VQGVRVLKAAAVEVGDVPALTGAAAARLDALQEEHRREVEAAYRQGVEDGRRQAESTGVAAAPMLARAVEHAVASASVAAAQQQAADAAAVVDAGIELARWVLRRELEADPQAMLDRVAEAMTSLRGGPSVEIRVAPALVTVMTEAAGSGVTVVADASLEPGEAVVQAGPASADLTFDQAFRRAREVLT